MPGTDLWERLDGAGRLLLDDLPGGYGYLDAHHVRFEPPNVTADQLLSANREAVRRATTVPAMLRGLWRTWRRTGNPMAALASFQNNRWARINVRASLPTNASGRGDKAEAPSP